MYCNYSAVAVGVERIVGAPLVDLREAEGLLSCFMSLNLEEMELPGLRLYLLIICELIAIFILADLDPAKELCKILEAHPEGPVILISFEVQFLFKIRGPQSRSVAPIASPFEFTPGVSELHKSL